MPSSGRDRNAHVSAGCEAEEAIFQAVSVAAAEPQTLIEKPRIAIAAPNSRDPAPAASSTPSQEMTSGGPAIRVPPRRETEPGRPIAVASMTSSAWTEEPAKPARSSRF